MLAIRWFIPSGFILGEGDGRAGTPALPGGLPCSIADEDREVAERGGGGA